MFKPLTNPPSTQRSYKERLASTTLREFDGGWNVIDTDLNLSNKFATVFRNFFRSPDGSVEIRPGTRFFTQFTGLDEIINCYYFANALIAVGKNGVVQAANGQGIVITLWNDEIAATLDGNPAGWSTGLEFCSFAVFNNDLIICNGIDKPLIVDVTLRCQYLYDLGSNSNINTPVGRYVTTGARYTIIAGDPIEPSILHISAQNTSGTWVGDPAPNDAITFDIGTYVSDNSIIKGIAFFRDKLIVAVEKEIVVIVIGNYDDSSPAVHVPVVEDVIPNHGSISHRAIQSLGDDMLFCDIVGVPSVARALFTEQIKPDRVSQLIDPAIQARIDRLSEAALEDRVFSVYNRREGQYMLFVPNNSANEDIYETIGFVYTRIKALKVDAWSEYRGWNWRSGCVSAQGNVFLSNSNDMYVLGNKEKQYSGDRVGREETFSDQTMFSDGTGWQMEDNPTDERIADSGIPIKFDWHLPWADFDNRMRKKTTRYLGVESEGRAAFTVDMFVDNILEDRSNTGQPFSDNTYFSDGYGWFSEDPTYDPALSMQFVAGDTPGYGLQPFGRNHFGGGRRSSDERLYAWTAHGKLFKLRIHGQSRERLKVVSMSIMYHEGSIRR